jgi:NAD(P)-dependent dehydrogenase (short-subunit alcohol dehydrogenase family)
MQTGGSRWANFTDKVVVITGRQPRYRKAIAMSFAREGAQTVLAASSQANLDAAASAVGNAGPEAPHLRGRPEDVGRPARRCTPS